jgi:hypothetical protein
VKLMRTIRFDASDHHVFERAAEPDEWAVSGAFAFAALGTEALVGKTRQAFSNGFLSLESFGRATFVSVAELPEEEVEPLTERLAGHLVAHYGAPRLEAALPAAREELEFALDLCREAQVNTVLAVSRRLDEEGRIREEFRSVAAPGDEVHTRIWDVVEE